MRLRQEDDHRPNVIKWIGIAGVAATGIRLLDDLVRRHDAKLLAEHEHARKMVKKARKKAKKTKKKLMKGKSPLATSGDRRLVAGGH
jgi:hypothetical protein